MKRHDAQSTSASPAVRSPWKRAATIAVAIALLALSGPVNAQDQWGAHFVRTAHVEGQVTIQRASEIRSEDALLNMPVIPGDRLWTGVDGRAELQLADGMLLRMNVSTKLDTEALGVPGDAENDITVLRLWSGSVILSGGIFDSAAKTLQLDTPAGSAFLLEDGLTRIDIDADGAMVVSVFRGLTEVVALNSSVLVRAGQRTVVAPGYAPEEPFTFNTTELDDFGYWSDERDQRHSANYSESYVDESIAAYTYDLTDYGNWFYASTYGSYCWRPYVGYGWSPYHYGYWNWYPWGYYWYSWEPWGWACYHYGRWDWIPGYGWAWIPDNQWGGGWVRWGVGSDYVGWAPLDHYDRAATVTYDQRGNQGLSYRQGQPLTVNTSDGSLRNLDANSWTFARPDALSAAGRSGDYLAYEEVTDRKPMKLLTSPLAVSQKDAGNPGPAVQKLFNSPGHSGGTPEKAVSPSSAFTSTGRRYAVTGSSPYTNSYRSSRTGGSAGVVTRPSTHGSSFSGGSTAPRTGTRYGSTAVPPRSTTRSSSYSRQIYNGVKQPSGSSGRSGTSRSTSSIPPRVSKSPSRTSTPPSRTRPPTTSRSAPAPRAPASPPPRSTSRPSAPKRSSGSSVSRPSSPSRSSGSRSSPSRSSGSSSSRGKKG